MGENTAIEWADHTMNPWIGCAKVSPGCARCYAETLVTGRMNRPDAWREDGVRQRTSESLWKNPLRWERNADAFMAEHGRRQRVFCASLADVFEPRPELTPWRSDLFRLIEATPSLDWLILTKRPEEARDWLQGFDAEKMRGFWTGLAVTRDDLGWGVLPNVWIGTSIENSRFTWRADVLRDIPAVVRFISAEPLLGSLFAGGHGGRGEPGTAPSKADETPARRAPLDLFGIDWLIVGGESGGRESRPMHPDWARELRDACLEPCERCNGGGGVAVGERYGETTVDLVEDPCSHCDGRGRGPAFFFKQWGSYAPRGGVSLKEDTDDRPVKLVKGDPGSSREGGRVDWNLHYYGSGPKSGGKVLDLREWCEFPERQAVAA